MRTPDCPLGTMADRVVYRVGLLRSGEIKSDRLLAALAKGGLFPFFWLIVINDVVFDQSKQGNRPFERSINTALFYLETPLLKSPMSCYAREKFSTRYTTQLGSSLGDRENGEEYDCAFQGHIGPS